MTRALSLTVLVTILALSARFAQAHCQVPCGIYGDERRIEELLEDQATIAKAQAQINDLAGAHEAQSLNQLVRWVTTKEAHASNVQKVMADYFLAQRIKADKENYTDQLKAAHAVIVAAMKCKQSSDPATAEALKTAVFGLYEAYTGKKPQLHEH